MPIRFKPDNVILTLIALVFWAVLPSVEASSHRESPIIGNNFNRADASDFYAFVAYNATGEEVVNVVAEFPSLDESSKDNGALTPSNLSEQTIYTVHLDDNGDSRSDYSVAVNLSALHSSSISSGTSGAIDSKLISFNIPDCPRLGWLSIQHLTPLQTEARLVSGESNTNLDAQFNSSWRVSLEIQTVCVTVGGNNLHSWSTSSQLSSEAAVQVSRPDAPPSNSLRVNAANRALNRSSSVVRNVSPVNRNDSPGSFSLP